MKVKALQDFRDREHDLSLRKRGTVLEVTDARAKKLSGLGLAEIVQEKSAEKKG